jgi:hypothetical protein
MTLHSCLSTGQVLVSTDHFSRQPAQNKCLQVFGIPTSCAAKVSKQMEHFSESPLLLLPDTSAAGRTAFGDVGDAVPPASDVELAQG